MSIFFDALKKAKGEQIETLFDTKDKTVAPVIHRYPSILQQNPVKEQPDLSPTESKEETPLINVTSKPNPAFTKSFLPPTVVSNVKKHHQVILPRDNTKLIALNLSSPASEQFALLGARLVAVSRTQDIKTICVTSAIQNEGKTFVAANLALALAAETERGVVIIDADLRRPSLHHSFGIKEATGLADFLQSERSSIDSLIIDTDKKLSFIPAGRIPSNNPLPLLDSEKMKQLISELRNRYDFVIIDTPPTAPLADTDILASLTDGLIFVIKAGETPLAVIQRSLKILGKHKILGTVLNQTAKTINYGYYYRNSHKNKNQKNT